MPLAHQIHCSPQRFENVGRIRGVEPAGVGLLAQRDRAAGQGARLDVLPGLPGTDIGVESEASGSLSQQLGVSHGEDAKIRMRPAELEQDVRADAGGFARSDGQHRLMQTAGWGAGRPGGHGSGPGAGLRGLA
jgi:hypothetical protein